MCGSGFPLLRPWVKQACTSCKQAVCASCSTDSFPVQPSSSPSRVCDACSVRLRAAHARAFVRELEADEAADVRSPAFFRRTATLAAALWLRAPLALPALLFVLSVGGHVSLLTAAKLSLLTVGGLAVAGGAYGAGRRVLFWQGAALLQLLTSPLYTLLVGGAVAFAAGVRVPSRLPSDLSAHGLAEALAPRRAPGGALGRVLAACWRWVRAGEIEYRDCVVEVERGGTVYLPVEVAHRSELRVVLSPAPEDGDGGARDAPTLEFPVDVVWLAGPREVSQFRLDRDRGAVSKFVSGVVGAASAAVDTGAGLTARGYEGPLPRQARAVVPGGPSLAVVTAPSRSLVPAVLRRSRARLRVRVYGRAIVNVFAGLSSSSSSAAAAAATHEHES